MYCGSCGKENDDNSLFCAYCGNKLLKYEYDKKYDEAVEHLKYEGYDILTSVDEEVSVNSNTTNDLVEKINKADLKTKNSKNSKVEVNEVNLPKESIPNKFGNQLEFDNKNNTRDYKNNMGQVIVNETPKKKSLVPIIICIVILAFLIIGGIIMFAYYLL